MTAFLQLNNSEFEDTYRPVRAKDGRWRDYNWTDPEDAAVIEQARRERRLSTIIDFDGIVGLGSGWHFVNRLGYVVTEVAVPAEICVDVIDLDGMEPS